LNDLVERWGRMKASIGACVRSSRETGRYTDLADMGGNSSTGQGRGGRRQLLIFPHAPDIFCAGGYITSLRCKKAMIYESPSDLVLKGLGRKGAGGRWGRGMTRGGRAHLALFPSSTSAPRQRSFALFADVLVFAALLALSQWTPSSPVFLSSRSELVPKMRRSLVCLPRSKLTPRPTPASPTRTPTSRQRSHRYDRQD
jgi:hypothetical protein